MSKIELDTITAGYNLSKINNNFQELEDELNNKVLYRDHIGGEPNHMNVTFDMNNNRIINLPDAVSGSEPVTLNQLQGIDSGEALYFIQAGTGAVTRIAQDKMREWVSVTDFGAIGDGIVDDTTAIVNALSAGTHILFPAGTYLISSTITKLLTHDLYLDLSFGAKIVATSSITGAFFDFDGGGTYKLTSCGGEFNVSNVLNITQNKGTVFLLSNLSSAWGVSGAKFIAGGSFLDGLGDTGIAYINCAPGEIRNNYFKGFADTGIYATGDNNPSSVDDGSPATIIGNEFYRCSVGVAIKRQHSGSVVLSNSFVECQNPVAALTTSELPEPGNGIKVIGNTFKRSIATAINIRGGKGQFTIIGNTIEDWGYDLAGAPVSGTKAAIKIEGSLGSVVSSNHIRMQTYPDASNIAVVLENETVDSIEYKHGGNNITGNIISNCLQGIREAVLGSAPNYASDNVFVGVTTPLLKVNTESIFRSDFSVQNVTLGAITVPAGGTSALIELPFVWAVPNMVVWVTAVSSAGFSPDIVYSCRAVTGKLQFIVKNNKASSIDLSTCTLSINATTS